MTKQSLASLQDLVWTHLARGVADRRHPARHPTLATVGPDGPEVRTLVLRKADRAEARLDLHTDMTSPKVTQIRADPRVALHAWVSKDRLQIRLNARAEVSTGDPDVFASLPDAARMNYGGAVPGTDLPAPPLAENDPGRFATIRLNVQKIDALILDDPHIRAVFTEPDWLGRWVAP